MSVVCCAALALMLPGKFYPSVSYTSDYRYNGVSYSDGEPTPQASLHWIGPQGWYAGVWTSGVDFNDPGNTSIEGDVYAGRTVDFGRRTRVAAEVLYTFFPDRDFSGPTYDFLQLKVRASRAFDAVTLGVLAAWTPEASYRSGTAWRVAADATVTLHAALKASATVGRRWVEVGQDRSFWDAGVTGSWKRLSLDLRYVDTNIGEGTVVATLTLRFW